MQIICGNPAPISSLRTPRYYGAHYIVLQQLSPLRKHYMHFSTNIFSLLLLERTP